jgi:hypothetical protein
MLVAVLALALVLGPNIGEVFTKRCPRNDGP